MLCTHFADVLTEAAMPGLNFRDTQQSPSFSYLANGSRLIQSHKSDSFVVRGGDYRLSFLMNLNGALSSS